MKHFAALSENPGKAKRGEAERENQLCSPDSYQKADVTGVHRGSATFLLPKALHGFQELPIQVKTQGQKVIRRGSSVTLQVDAMASISFYQKSPPQDRGSSLNTDGNNDREYLSQRSCVLRNRDSEKSSVLLNATQQNGGKNPGQGSSFAVLDMRSKLAEVPDRQCP
ncbi:hypothetical protein STEG23_031675 [Scotinomys teguina]